MAPTPDTVEPIVRIPGDSDDNKSTENQYINDGFVMDNDGKLHPPPMPNAYQTVLPGARADASKFDKNPASLNGSMRRSTPETMPPNLDFDDILPHIGEFGTYQKILFFLMIPFAFSVAFVYFSQIFLTLVPDKHWCQIPELRHLSIEQRWVRHIAHNLCVDFWKNFV